MLGQATHLLHHGHGLAAVADQVAQQCELFGALGAGVLQAGVQGLAVGVDVGQQGDFHGVVSNPIIARMAECQLAGGSACVALKKNSCQRLWIKRWQLFILKCSLRLHR